MNIQVAQYIDHEITFALCAKCASSTLVDLCPDVLVCDIDNYMPTKTNICVVRDPVSRFKSVLNMMRNNTFLYWNIQLRVDEHYLLDLILKTVLLNNVDQHIRRQVDVYNHFTNFSKFKLCNLDNILLKHSLPIKKLNLSAKIGISHKVLERILRIYKLDYTMYNLAH